MQLNYRKYGNGNPLLILHGLFGSSDNWQSLGKKFSEDYQVYLIDLRNHGHSPHSKEFTYELMAEDINELDLVGAKQSTENPGNDPTHTTPMQGERC